MPSTAEPVCFVAMAFEKPDTDELYDSQVLPVLKRNHVKPVVINRRQSNTDLNIQIVQQITKANFCIADLTYARPSVYWEAGFAQRAIPVIYTARKDHLAPGQPDDLRVHFDLQMKPLLLWKAPDDATFASRLDNRLKSTVLREWAALQEKSSAVEAAIREFGILSLAERLNLIRSTALTSLRSIGYPHWENVSHLRARYREEDIIAGKVNHVFSHKKSHHAFQFVSVHAFESATKSEIEAVKRELYSPYDGSLRPLPNELPKVDAVFANHVMLSIRPVPAVRIERAFPSLRLITPPAIYGGFRRSTSRRQMQSGAQVSLFESWHFISGIVSEPQLRQRMKETTMEYIAHQAA